jgi:hypothetical protein
MSEFNQFKVENNGYGRVIYDRKVDNTTLDPLKSIPEFL